MIAVAATSINRRTSHVIPRESGEPISGYSAFAEYDIEDSWEFRYIDHMTAKLDPKLLEILVCPLTKVPLRYDAAKQELISDQAGLAYPIRDGIPIMLVEEARKI